MNPTFVVDLAGGHVGPGTRRYMPSWPTGRAQYIDTSAKPRGHILAGFVGLRKRWVPA